VNDGIAEVNVQRLLQQRGIAAQPLEHAGHVHAQRESLGGGIPDRVRQGVQEFAEPEIPLLSAILPASILASSSTSLMMASRWWPAARSLRVAGPAWV
jgi:hypothetical protein